MDLRPLDRFGSLKLKLGVLIASTVTLSIVFTLVVARLGVRHLYSLPLTVVVALIVTQLLARGMTSPIRDMTAAAGAMAGGDYSRRVPETSQDEVGELARAFNTMSAQLGRVEQQRRDLVANVSHELRTPITALQAVLENIIDGVSEPDPQTLRVALAQTVRLGRLVTDLLDLSRVDAGIETLHREAIEVVDLFTAAVAESAMVERGVDYRVEVVDPDLTLSGDRARLHQLMANLIDNASRHAGPGGRVTLRAVDAGGAVVMDVIDTGPGIPAAERDWVFERFTTGGATDGGTGLGLAICRWVTQLHGGTIAVADAAPGCDIRVVLPARRGMGGGPAAR